MRALPNHTVWRTSSSKALLLPLSALVCAACARTSETPDEARSSATVFTDTALFRENCLEADSGLTIAVQRCTPRNQANQPGQPLERQPPDPPQQP